MRGACAARVGVAPDPVGGDGQATQRWGPLGGGLSKRPYLPYLFVDLKSERKKTPIEFHVSDHGQIHRSPLRTPGPKGAAFP